MEAFERRRANIIHNRDGCATFLTACHFIRQSSNPYKNFRTTLDFLFFQQDFWKTNLQVIGTLSLVKLIQMIVVPLQGTVFGWVPHPRLKPGVKHG